MKAVITDEWNKFLDLFKSSQKDIYYCEEYVKLYAGSNAVPLCIVIEDGGKVLLMPFLRGKTQNYFDYETPYGYGGPIANTQNMEWISTALSEMATLFKEKNYLCGFIRFHPLLNNNAYCRGKINIIYDRPTVAIDTSCSEDSIWNEQLSAKNRNMIRKAEKNGLIYKTEHGFESLDGFVELYDESMKRLNADPFYFFSAEYYQNYVQGLKGHAFMGTVCKDGKLICGGLFMYSGHYGHYHLAGGKHESGANNLLLWGGLREMKKLGVMEFHLGGGYDSNVNNTLLKFKMSFSKNIRNFYIGKVIYRTEAYRKICNEWEEANPDKAVIYGNRLLKYKY